MILFVMIFILGIVVAYLLLQVIAYKKIGVDIFKRAAKEKKPVLFLESTSGYYPMVAENQMENISFTKSGDVIITPAGTLKSCPPLGGIQVGHGDLYLSALVPMDLKKFVDDKVSEGLSIEDIADEIDKIADEKQEVPKKYKTKEKKNFKLYKAVSFDNIRNFLNTGMNRTLLKAQLNTLVRKNQLSQMFGGRNWMSIVIPAAILIIIVAAALVMLQNSGFFEGWFTAGKAAAGNAAQIAK